MHRDGHIVNLELFGIEGLKVKGRSSLIGMLTLSRPVITEAADLDKLNINDLEDFEQALDLIAGKRSYVSIELINKLISVFHNNNEEGRERQSDGVVSFSERELEVLGYVCKGLSTKEIADKMFISSRTVEKHRANLMTKTDAKNIIEVIIYAVKNKLINI